VTKDFDCTLAEKSHFVTIFSLCMFIYQYCRCCAAYINYSDAEISVRYSILLCLLYFKLIQATDLDTTIHTQRQGQVLCNVQFREAMKMRSQPPILMFAGTSRVPVIRWYVSVMLNLDMTQVELP
jgi:hypothetical protein